MLKKLAPSQWWPTLIANTASALLAVSLVLAFAAGCAASCRLQFRSCPRGSGSFGQTGETRPSTSRDWFAPRRRPRLARWPRFWYPVQSTHPPSNLTGSGADATTKTQHHLRPLAARKAQKIPLTKPALQKTSIELPFFGDHNGVMLNAVFCAIRSPNLRIPSLKLLGLTVAFSIAGCNQEPFTKTGAVSASSAYQCGENDYRSFEKLSVFQRMDSYVPRAKHTEAQRLALDPGTALWHMPTQPQLTCNAQNHLEMRYAVIGASDFANAHDRIIVEIAPAGRLLDAVMLQRLKAVAGAANEALTTLRTKNCSKTDAYEGCDLKVNPDPSLFRKTPQGQIIYEEFPSVGLRAWFRFFKHDDRYATKTVFTTADSKFDVSFLIESKDVEGTTHSSFGVVVELLSSEYDLSSYTKSSASKEQK